MAITPRFDSMNKSLGSFNLNIAYVNGAGAATNIPITGIKEEDEILSAFASDIAPANDQSPIPVTDLTITSDGNVQTAGASTGSTLVIFWIDKNI